jgi:hypothetical protein
MHKVSFGLTVALVAGAIMAGTAGAAVQSKCLSSKTKCASKKAFALLKCEWKAETPGKPADPNADACVDKATTKFDGGDQPEIACFEKLENNTSNDCVTQDDTDTVETLVDQCVASVVSTIDPAPIDQTKCGVSKKKCAAKTLKKLLKCYAKAETPGKPNDPNSEGCLDKARAKLDGGADPENGCVVKLENSPRSDCAPPLGNQTDIEAAVDACVSSIIGALETPPTTTTTTSSTTSSVIGSTSTSTPTGSTTTTSTPSQAACSANGLVATVSLAYNEQTVGGISAIHFRLDYVPPLSIPGSLNVSTVRARVTNLAAPATLSNISDNDTNTNGVDDALELNARRTDGGSISPGPILSVRYDCPLGNMPSAPGCVLSQATDLAGLPFPPEQAALIGCTVALSSAP